MVYPTSIVLSHRINPDNSLSEQTKKRVDKGIELYYGKEVDTMTFSGGYADKEATMTHADAMSLYALQQGMSQNDLFLEEKSLDTVGQAIFSKRDIIIPQNWERLTVVSHDYHLPRVRTIFGFVYGRDFDIHYVGVPDLQKDCQSIESERKSLEAFLKTFEGVKSGNDEQILNALIERHPLYRDFK